MTQTFGPTLLADGVRFGLWAPGAGKVELLLDEREVLMQPLADGFFETTVGGARAGARYRFRRDGGAPLPDPASRAQPEGVHGASELVDLRHAWTDSSFHGRPPEELVIYELHVGTFSEAGTFRGVEARLAHLVELGITAIEVMPVAAFPGRRGWGYDGTFHFAPFAGYGRPRDLQALVDAAHRRGVAVILDVVTNHFGPDGNAMWSLAPAFFRPDHANPWSSGINWAAEPVLRYFAEMAAFWVREYHVDGLRFDAFHIVPQEFRAQHLSLMLEAVAAQLEPGRHFVALLESVDNESSLLGDRSPALHVMQLNFDFQRASHRLLTREQHGEYADYEPASEHFERCLLQGFSLLDQYSPYHRKQIGEAAPPASFDAVANFLQNHDSTGNRCLGERLERLIEPALLEAATALFLLHPGVPFLFMGQEWQASTPFLFFTDLAPHLLAAVREGRERGFRELAGGSPPPHVPHCDEQEAFDLSILRWEELRTERHRSFLGFVRELLALRRLVVPRMTRRTAEVDVQRRGALFAVRIGPRAAGHDPFLLLCNLGQEALAFNDLLDVVPGELLYSTRPSSGQEIAGPATMLLSATWSPRC